ncbi:hypothetical protein HYH03_011606 [Edaphochlamys debaryana]|uniref:MYND-type domain-containing protein n=1 Tax=Edaphochlamys debaryana TaxID=47281 RepID=A0A835XRS1_9CHLO|nr:hypothetical protein HYH03_011606 [Edaphochlamys debaryana]|eukprot:KAG2489977.1 hypothetical protein HYH03_011606 [Edaphochlamys debaryana]
MGVQALRMASGKEACAWSPTEITAASEALDRLGTQALRWVGDEGVTGVVVMFGLALRRAAPNSPGISDAQRAAYASLHSKLLNAIIKVCRDAADHVLSPRAPLQVCTALIKTHVLRSFCPLLAAAASPLLPAGGAGQPQPRPSSRAVQAFLSLLKDACCVLLLFHDALGSDYLSDDDYNGLASALHEELAASGLLEHWARLALALASWEEGEDGAAKAQRRLGCSLWTLLDYGDTSPLVRSFTSGACPSLAYLLTSHLVALAAELDGGPTYGLPTAPADGSAAGPSSSSSAPQPRARPAIPLAGSQGYVLRHRETLDVSVAVPALGLWSQALSNAASTATGGFTCCPDVQWPAAGVPTNPWSLARGVMECRLGQLQAAVRERRAAAAEAGAGAVLGAPEDLEAAGAEEQCAGMLAALRRREPLLDCSAAFQLGMRLARAAACALRGCTLSLIATSCATAETTEAAVQALIAAHDTAAWTDPGSLPLQLQGAEAAGRLVPEKAIVLAWRGLGLARRALDLARHMCDGGCPGIAPWLKRRLGAWWQATIAWAGLWRVEANGTAAPFMRVRDACGLLAIKISRAVCHNDAWPSTAIGAFYSGAHKYMPVLESYIRNSLTCSGLQSAGTLPGSALLWSRMGSYSRPGDVSSFAGTLAKLLRAARTPPASADAKGRRRGIAALTGALALSLEGPSYEHPALSPASEGQAPQPDHIASKDKPGWPHAAAHVALTALPAAAALGRALAPGVLRRLDGGGALELEGDGGALGDVVALLLDWLPPLLVAAEGRRAGSAAVGSVAAAAADAADSKASSSSASDPSAPSASEREWSAFLWTELDPAWALRVGLRLAETAEACRTPLPGALLALAVRAPSRLQAMVAAAGTEEQGREAVGGALGGPSLSALRRVLGPGGALSEPALLALIEAAVGCGGGASGGPSVELSGFAKFIRNTASLMPPPSEARRSLPGCSNPACTNLAGLSEEALSVQQCGGCDAARYCCRECQAAHWEAGHKRECRAGAAAAES